MKTLVAESHIEYHIPGFIAVGPMGQQNIFTVSNYELAKPYSRSGGLGLHNGRPL